MHNKDHVTCAHTYDFETGNINIGWSGNLHFDQVCEDVDECQNNPCSHGCFNYYR